MLYRKTLYCAVAALACFGCSSNSDQDAARQENAATSTTTAAARLPLIDLNDRAQNLNAFVRVRGSLDPNEEVVFHWTGNIYTFIKEEAFPTTKTNRLLFKFQGFNVARFETLPDGGVRMVSREASFYEDPRTGEIVECWRNPLNDKNVSVLQVWNDSYGFDWSPSSWSPMPHDEFNGRVVFANDILLAYPSALPTAQFADYSAGNVYQGVELFNFFVDRTALQTASNSVSTEISWTRVGQYLPWMQLGQTPGNLIYQARGAKARSWEDLPQNVRAYVAAKKPEYQHPPTFSPGQRNETSWSYFKKQTVAGTYTPTCAP